MKDIKQQLKTTGAILTGIVFTGCAKRQMVDYVVKSNHGNKIEYVSRLNPNKTHVIQYDNPTQIYYYTHIRPGDTITGYASVLNRTTAKEPLGLEVRRVNRQSMNAFIKSVRRRQALCAVKSRQK